MKHTLITTLIALAFIAPSPAQSLEKGSMVIGAGAGIGIYRTTWIDKTNTGNPDNKDTSVAAVYPFTFEYAVMNWLGVGARLNYSYYLRDSAAKAAGDKAFSYDASACVNAHFLRVKHVDMFISGEYGYSHFAYTTNQANNARAYANGSCYSIGFNTRFYFGDAAKFGIHLRYAREGYNYQNGVITDDTANPDYKFGLKGNGGVFGLGLQYRI